MTDRAREKEKTARSLGNICYKSFGSLCYRFQLADARNRSLLCAKLSPFLYWASVRNSCDQTLITVLAARPVTFIEHSLLYQFQQLFWVHQWHSCYSTVQRMSRWQYRFQCVKKTNATAAEKESGVCFWAVNRDSGGHLDTEAKQVPQVKKAVSVKENLLFEEMVDKFNFFSAEILLQLMSEKAKKEL